MTASEMSKRDPRAHYRRSKYRRSMVRSALDAIGAALLFAMATAVCTSAPVRACAFSGAFAGLERPNAPQTLKAIADAAPPPIIEIATTTSARDPNAVFRRTSSTAAWSLLGLSFSVLAALNLSFFRHLRRAYARPSMSHQDVK